MMARHKFTQREGMKERMKKVNVFFGKVWNLAGKDFSELRIDIIESRIPKQLEKLRMGKLSKRQEAKLIKWVCFYGNAAQALDIIENCKDIDENSQIVFSTRINLIGTAIHAFKALMSGKITVKEAQISLTKKVRAGKIVQASALLRSGIVTSKAAQYFLVDKVCCEGSADQIFEVIMSDKVIGEEDKELLVERLIKMKGTSEQAMRVIDSGVVLSEKALESLVDKIYDDGTIAQAKTVYDSKKITNKDLNDKLLSKFQLNGQ